jgi:hypothetical protein
VKQRYYVGIEGEPRDEASRSVVYALQASRLEQPPMGVEEGDADHCRQDSTKITIL